MVSILGGIITGFGNFGIAYSLGYISSEVIRQVSNQQFNLNQFYVFWWLFLVVDTGLLQRSNVESNGRIESREPFESQVSTSGLKAR